LYVDYDAGSGLPIINGLSGELEATFGGSTVTFSPIQSIAPRRNVSIDRGNRAHTLNFFIHENFCIGTVTLRTRVFDVFDRDQFSMDFQCEIRFEDIPELPIMAIGIDYTGEDVREDASHDELTAPEMSDFVDVFEFTEQVYPIPSIVITSYNTMAYDKEMESDISEGCDKFSDLKDALADMRGDSDDIVYGMLNSGVNTGSVGGCGGGGVSLGIIGRQGTAAHEVGHALGRQHAPCDNVTRCAEPANHDDGYPKYSGYNSDSIGEYGFDPRRTFGRVLDPGNTHDFMGYSGNRWVSPYTYKALMSLIPSEFNEAGVALMATFISRVSHLQRRVEDGEWLRKKTPHLFLRIDIPRNRKVLFHEAFHFDTRPRSHDPNLTDFLVELLDEEGNVLRRSCLYVNTACCNCGSDGYCWPVRIRQAVPYHPKSQTLVLYECDKEIHRQDILPSPAVNVKCSGVADKDANTITVLWEVELPESCKSVDVWFLVQWQDPFGIWRGCAPRTKQRKLVIPKRLFCRRRQIAFRVLATCGIATGLGVWQGECKYHQLQPGTDEPVVVRLAGIPAKGKESLALPTVIRAVPVSSDGLTHSWPEIRWYDEKGGEIGQGHSFDLRALPRGQALLGVAVLDRGQRSGYAQWLIERSELDQFKLLRGTISKKKTLERDCNKE
jgi:hypothetical protein